VSRTSRDTLQDVFRGFAEVLGQAGFSVDDAREIAYGLQFTVRRAGWSGLVRVYMNKRGEHKTDLSQIGGGEEAAEVARLLTAGAELPAIGADEAGKGDYFGPLVCAAVHVDQKSASGLILAGVRDSKKISDRSLLVLADRIAEICRGRYHVVALGPAEYNSSYRQFRESGGNLNALLARTHARAVREVCGRVKCRRIIVDRFARPELLEQILAGFDLLQVPRAERHIAVAAASILARARFLRDLEALGTEFEFDFAPGASPEVVRRARGFVEIHGAGALERVAKLHFKTTRQVLPS